MRKLRFPRRLSLMLCSCLILLQGIAPVMSTDGNPILELGTFSWLDYKKKQLLVDVADVRIRNRTVQKAEITVSLYQAVIFENQDENANHRLIFIPGVDNMMESAYNSPVIEPGERWGLELHSMGVFPYRCSIHPEEHGAITVKL